ncbi:endonuclease domain-containing protein [bacterium]|nr:endonuclease domain-containing protein [bacterium]
MNERNILAKKLRQNQTPQERKMWNLLRNHKIENLKFKRQYPIGKYIVDFICTDIQLIIEIDGGQHNEPHNIQLDSERTQYLKSRGYEVIRFWNNDIDNNIEGVYKKITETINNLRYTG